MANAASINVAGNRFIPLVDPTSGTLANPANIDGTLIPSIDFTASGGAVSATKVRIPKKYPRVESNQFKCRFALDRRVKFGETVTVDIPASMMMDGTEQTHGSASGLSVTNESYYHDSIADLISDTTPIVFVDPTLGNDGTGTVYTRTDILVGSDPESPAGAVLPYATLKAAMDDARGSTSYTGVASINTHFVALIKSGETINGSTDRVSTAAIISGVRGESLVKPAIFGRYGGSSQVTFTPATGQNCVRMQGNERYLIFSRGLKFGETSTNPSLYWRTNNNQTTKNFMFLGCEIATVIAQYTAGNEAYSATGFAFINCVFGHTDGIGFNIPSPDANRFWYDLNVQDCLFTDIGASSLDHAVYIKHGEDWDEEGTYDFETSGGGRKLDKWHGVHISRRVTVRTPQMALVETNGGNPDDYGGEQTDRTEESGGSYSEHVTIERSILSDGLPTNDPRFGEASGGGPVSGSMQGIDIACSSDVEIKNNLFILNENSTGPVLNYRTAVGADNDPGTPYNEFLAARDGFRWSIHHNTFILTGHKGVKINIPESDDFSIQNSKGWHDTEFYANIIYAAAGNANTLIEFANADYQTAKAVVSAASPEGRCSGTWTDNCVYAVDGETGIYAAHNGSSLVTLNTAAALISAIGSDLANLRFENPAPADPLYAVSDYVTSVAGGSYADLDAAFAAIEAGILTESIPAELTVEAIADAVLQNHVQTALSAANYGGYTPGVTNWAEDDAPAGTGPDIRVVGLPNGSDYTFGERNISNTPLQVTLTVANLGDATGTFGAITASGHASIVSGPADNDTLAASASVSLVLSLSRSAGGDRLGTVTIPVDGEDPYVLTLSANIRAPFGQLTTLAGDPITTAIGVSGLKDAVITTGLKVRNSGTATMTGIDINADAGLTLDSSAPLSIAPGSSAQVDYIVVSDTVVAADPRIVTVDADFIDQLSATFSTTITELSAGGMRSRLRTRDR